MKIIWLDRNADFRGVNNQHRGPDLMRTPNVRYSEISCYGTGRPMDDLELENFGGVFGDLSGHDSYSSLQELRLLAGSRLPRPRIRLRQISHQLR
jgi:hypothetical protein